MWFIGNPTARRLGAASVIAVAAVGTTGCEFITGVPDVARVELTVNPTTFTVGANSGATAASYKDNGSVITHRRRVPRLSSSNPAVAEVTPGGTVIGRSEGTATIKAEAGGKSDTVVVTVLPARPTRIDLAPEAPRVFVDETRPIAVRAFLGTGEEIGNFALTCSTANPLFATATASGNTCTVRGLVQGSTQLLLSVNGVDRQVTLVIDPTRIVRVTADIRRPIRETEQVQVGVSIFSASGPIPTTGRGFAYSTSDPTIATVSNTGVVTGQGEGTATITVITEGDIRTTTQVVVTKIPVVTVIVPPTVQYRVGLQGTIQVIPYDSLNRPLSSAGRTVRYTSTDTSVLRVAPSGIVNALRLGTASIIGSVDGVADTAEARVTEIPVGQVRIDSTQVNKIQGQTFQFTATVFDSTTRRVTDRVLTWRSSDPVAAPIDPRTGLIRLLAPGTYRVTVEVPRIVGEPGNPLVDVTDIFVQPTPIASVRTTPDAVSVRAGESTAIIVTPLDSAGTELRNRNGNIEVTSSDPAIAIGSSEGVIRGIRVGSATLTYQAYNTAGQKQGAPATVTVTVTER